VTARLDRLGQALFEAFAANSAVDPPRAKIADVVLWSYGELPRGAGSILALQLDGGPGPRWRHQSRGTILCPASSITLTVDLATPGTKQIVELNDYAYAYDVTGPDTVTTIRDGLLADIAAGEADFLTAVANGADAIDLTASFLGGLRRMSLVGGDISDGGSAVFSGDAVLVTEGTLNLNLRLEAFSQNREPRNGAWSVMNAALERLQQVAVSEELARFGVGVGSKGQPIDLSLVRGANWETRVMSNVGLFTRHVAVEAVDQIETINTTLTVDPGNIVVATSTTAP
jgi:hypothetical protein